MSRRRLLGLGGRCPGRIEARPETLAPFLPETLRRFSCAFGKSAGRRVITNKGEVGFLA